jgi:nucleotide-binding universal stress UspA family protein
MARLTGRSTDLLAYDEVREKLKAKRVGERRLEEIPLDAIVGSVGRYHDFTRSFLPRQDSDEDRWAAVRQAMTGPGYVPPIEVYQIGQVYFVVDGNHRVSVARQLGSTHIQAYVTEVQTKVPLSPDVEPDDLILKAEYTDFLDKTHLDDLRPNADLSVTVPGQYQVLEEQIRVHRHFMSLERKRRVSYEEAVTHWYDEVYLPAVRVIRQRGILLDFPGRTDTDLYVWTLEHRASLEAELGWLVETETAAIDLAARFSPKPQRVVARVGERILDAVTPDEIEAGPPAGRWREERLARRQKDRMFADLLVAMDGQEAGWWALDHALFVAEYEKARVHGLHVVRSEAHLQSERVQVLREGFDRRCQAAGVSGELAVEVGEVPRRVCDRSRWNDLVILSLSYPPAPQPIARLSSGLSTIIRRCPRPVLMVPGTTPRLRRALLAYDGSPKSEEALFVATYLTVRWNIPLIVVTVMEMGRTTSDTFVRAQRYLEARGKQATFVKDHGSVPDVIVRAAEAHGCDLIIMGGYGFSPVVEIVVGSAVDEVLRTSREPVLICR